MTKLNAYSMDKYYNFKVEYSHIVYYPIIKKLKSSVFLAMSVYCCIILIYNITKIQYLIHVY